MQIHEITEGFFRNVATGFAQGVTGLPDTTISGATANNVTKDKNVAAPAASTQSTAGKTIPAQGTVFLVNIGGMEYFKSYQGQWFEKPDPANRFSASGALQIKDPVKTARLDTMLPQAKTVFVRPESPGNDIVFVPDPSGRTARLAAKRQKAKG